MLVGIDASRATPPPRTGTENYSVGLIRALVERGRHRYRLYFRQSPPAELADVDAERRVMPARRLWTHTRLSAELRRQPPGALLIPAHVLPATHPAASVVTVHDVGFRYYPEAYPVRQLIYLDLSTRWAARRAARLLADSEATRQDIHQLYRVSLDRIHVAYPAVDARFTPHATPDEAARLRATYGLSDAYLLYVGTLQPRKNVGVLIDALARLPRGDVTLALAGGAGWRGEADRLRDQVTRLGLTARVRFLGHVPGDDLPALMRQSVALALPSLHEGFGMPLAEAMACGAPTLAANTSCLPEVVGDAGRLLPPRVPDAWADAFTRLLDDSALRASLRARGLARAATFTWERAAQVAEAALEESVERET